LSESDRSLERTRIFFSISITNLMGEDAENPRPF
jgi:hypothetical protein